MKWIEAVSSEFGCKLIFRYRCVGDVYYPLRTTKTVGWRSSTNVFPIYATSVDVWTIPTRIAKSGLKAMER